jgi:predicted transposase
MRTTLTAKLKLTATPEQFQALRTTQLAYRDALNLVSQYAFAHGKTSSRRKLQRDLYAGVRQQHTLPAQMTCSVFRQVGATYQSLWTKARQNAEARRQGYTKKRFRGLDKAPHYVSPTLNYVYGRDYSLCTGHQVSLLTLSGRIHVSYQGYRRHVALLQQGTRLCGFTSKANRKGAGLLFVCRQCKYSLHADLVGARNILLRALVIRQDWMATGQLSDAPDVTDREAKAARLSRYAEVRWSLVTAPPLPAE